MGTLKTFFEGSKGINNQYRLMIEVVLLQLSSRSLVAVMSLEVEFKKTVSLMFRSCNNFRKFCCIDILVAYKSRSISVM